MKDMKDIWFILADIISGVFFIIIILSLGYLIMFL